MAATLSPKPTTVAMLSANDNLSVEVAKAVVDYAPSKGMQVVSNKTYPAAAPDGSRLLSQAKPLNPAIIPISGPLAEPIPSHKAARDPNHNAEHRADSLRP